MTFLARRRMIFLARWRVIFSSLVIGPALNWLGLRLLLSRADTYNRTTGFGFASQLDGTVTQTAPHTAASSGTHVLKSDGG